MTRWKLPGLQRDVSVPPRVAAPFLAQGDPQRTDQLAPRAARLDDVIDVPTLRRDVRVREALRVLGDQLAPVRHRVRGSRQLAMEDDVDRALRAHHGDLGRGPGDVEIGPDVL